MELNKIKGNNNDRNINIDSYDVNVRKSLINNPNDGTQCVD